MGAGGDIASFHIRFGSQLVFLQDHGYFCIPFALEGGEETALRLGCAKWGLTVEGESWDLPTLWDLLSLLFMCQPDYLFIIIGLYIRI